MVCFGLFLGCSSDDDDGGSSSGGADGGGSGGGSGKGGSTGGGGSGGSIGGSGGSSTGGSGGSGGGALDCGTDLGNNATCTTCLRANCCTEMKQCNDSNCKDFVDCARACPDPNDTSSACVTACKPADLAVSAFNGLLVCMGQKCAQLTGTGGTGSAGAAGAAGGTATGGTSSGTSTCASL